MSLFEIQELSFRYGPGTGFGLRSLRLSVERGSLIGILGANGAGKSTLLRQMAGLLSPDRGGIFFRGRSLERWPAKEKARAIAYVPQSAHFPFPLSVMEIVEMGRYPHLGRFQGPGPSDEAVCLNALEQCDALQFKDRRYDDLSGGEKQRVLIASALAQSPEVLLLDEPTLSLDLAHQVGLFELIGRLHAERSMTVVMATHELNLASRYLDHLVLMKGGAILAQGTPERTLTVRNIKSVLDVEVQKLDVRGGPPLFVPRIKAGRR